MSDCKNLVTLTLLATSDSTEKMADIVAGPRINSIFRQADPLFIIPAQI